MPWGDRTGPMGLGPRTGRGAGYCAGFGAPGFMNPWPGGGFGRGRGFAAGGRGWRHWFRATGLPGWARLGYGLPAYGAPVWGPPSPKAERELLERQVEALQAHLQDVKARLEELAKETGEEK